MVGKPLIANGVSFVFGVLAAVDFDDKPLLSADEVDDVRSDRLLADEFEIAERAGAKVTPELAFGRCCASAQQAGQTGFPDIGAAHAAKPPHPDPLPARGEREARGD
jgi:hypothetical protein